MRSRIYTSAVMVAALAAGLIASGCSPAASPGGTISGKVLAAKLVGGAGSTQKSSWRYLSLPVRIDVLAGGKTALVIHTTKTGVFRAEIAAGHYALRIESSSQTYPRCISKPATIAVRHSSSIRIKGYCYANAEPG